MALPRSPGALLSLIRNLAAFLMHPLAVSAASNAVITPATSSGPYPPVLSFLYVGNDVIGYASGAHGVVVVQTADGGYAVAGNTQELPEGSEAQDGFVMATDASGSSSTSAATIQVHGSHLRPSSKALTCRALPLCSLLCWPLPVQCCTVSGGPLGHAFHGLGTASK